jgi:hypothetical protein
MRVVALVLLIVSFAGTAPGQSSLTGYVRDDASLRGLQGVEVSVVGTDHRTRTDKEGKYSLRDVPAGNQRIQVRLVGFVQVDTILEFADKPLESVFFLGKAPVKLDTVVSKGRTRVVGAGYASFYERKALGFGTFFDSTFLRQNEHRRLPDILNGLRSVDVTVPGTCAMAHPQLCDWRVATAVHKGMSYCTLEVMIDGTVAQRSVRIDDRNAPPFSPSNIVQAYNDVKLTSWSSTFDLNQISLSNLIGVEVYRSAEEAPGMLGSDSDCGVLMLWTHR